MAVRTEEEDIMNCATTIPAPPERDLHKVCSCGTVYDRAGWEALPYVGVMRFDDGEPGLEMRNCACRSTLAIEVTS